MNLNFGPFNKCVDILEFGGSLQYAPSNITKVFAMTLADGTVREIDIQPDGVVTIPTFCLACTCDQKGDTAENRQSLCDQISAKAIKSIFLLHSTLETKINFDKLFIPVKTNVTIHLDPKHDELYGYVELGIAIGM